MSRRERHIVVIICLAVLTATAPTSTHAQGRRGRPPNPPGHFAVRGHAVFVGGYFYDPHFGPYPWWGPGVYRYGYAPGYNVRASLRVLATPKQAAVYVDGFYAGIVDDFDGFFQSLPLPSGGHEITLYEPGYRTVSQGVYLSPGSSFKLRETMERLPAGAVSEPPPVAPPVPSPPEDSFVPPRTLPREQPPSMPQRPEVAPETVGYGSLALHVHPANADVTIDGVRWATSDAGQFAIQMSSGSHHVEVAKPGYQTFSTDAQVRPGETTPLNIVLSQKPPR